METLNNLFKRFVPTLALLLCCALGASAQGIAVSGQVTDEAGESIIGATVTVKGQKGIGTVTDFDGNFHITVPSERSVIQVTYVGMNAEEVTVGRQRTLKIVMSEDNNQLNEVVVVGFGQ